MAKFKGTNGDDVINGTSGNDSFNLRQGGSDTANGGDGNDVFSMGDTLNAGDRIDGGTGTDTVALDGDYSAGLVLDAQTIQNVELLRLAGDFTYNLTLNSGNVAAGQTLAISANNVGPDGHLQLDGSAITDGDLSVFGSAEADTISMGGALHAGDAINGGAGNDTLILDGDYSASLVFGKQTMRNVEALQLTGHNGYDLTLNNANVSAGQTLTVHGDSIGTGGYLHFDGSAEKDGSFSITGSHGDDILIGGQLADTISLAGGGADTVHGGGGDDNIRAGATLTSADSIDGGDGFDTVVLSGDYTGGNALVLGPSTITNVEELSLTAGHSYDITTNDATVTTTGFANPFVVDASQLGTSNSLVFDGSAETRGSFNIEGGLGNDTITTGGGGDSINLRQGGTDTVHSGGGDDYVNAGGTFDLTDSLDGGSGYDTLELTGNYAGANALHLTDTMLANFEEMRLEPGGSYDITTSDGTVAAGVQFIVNGSFLGASDNFTFDGSAETDGSFDLSAGQSDHTHLTGGAGDDTFDLFNIDSTADTVVHGGGGDDFISFAGNFNSSSQIIDGGTGSNAMLLQGNYSSVSLLSPEISNIQTVMFRGAYVTGVQISGDISGGQTLIVDSTAQTYSGATLSLDASNSATAIDLKAGEGHNTVTGSAFADIFEMGATFSTSDSIDGGGGADLLILDGNYTGGNALVLNGSMMQNIDVLRLNGPFDYAISTNDDLLGAGQTLTINAGPIAGGHSLTFDGSAELDGSFAIFASAGDDNLTGGAQDDSFSLSRGGNDTVHGGGGNDTINMGAAFTAADALDGGAGSDTVKLDGDYTGASALVFSATTMTSVESLVLAGGHSYDITTNDATVAGGGNLDVDASALGATDSLTLNTSAETDGSFAITGGDGNDTINMGAAFTAADRIDGGAGNDTLNLDGDYSAGVTFGATTLTNVENIVVAAGHSYNLTANNATAHGNLAVNAAALGAADSLTFDGSAVTSGLFQMTGGAGNDVLSGGSRADTFDLTHGGNDTAHGGGGDDIFNMGAAFTAADSIDGGTGADTLNLDGDYSAGVTFGATTLTNVENIVLAAGHSYSLTIAAATVASFQPLTVDGSALGAGDAFTCDGSAASGQAFLSFVGGAGTDTLTGGAGSNDFHMGAGLTAADTIVGGSGSNYLYLDGDYSAGLTFAANTISHIPDIGLVGSYSYNLTTNDANVAAGQTLTFDLYDMEAGGAFTFNGSAETDGHFEILAYTPLVGGASLGPLILTGGSQQDQFYMYGNMSSTDSIDGGGGADILSLNGDYSAALTFGATTLTNVETIELSTGHSYNLTTSDATVAAGQTLTVDGNLLSSGDVLTFNGAAETDGSFAITGGSGNDALTGGSQADTFNLSGGGNDTVHAGDGDDTFNMGAALTASDSLDGGAGTDTLNLNGDYSGGLTFGATTLTNVEDIVLAAGHSYNLTTDDGNVASGQTLTVDGSALGAGSAVTFNGAAETDGSFNLTGGAGNDTLTGGRQADTFDLTHGGNDTVHAGDGNDTINMGAAFTAADTIDGGAGNDTLVLNGDYSTELDISSSMLSNVENLTLTTGIYNLKLTDDTVAGTGMTIDASAANGVTFDGSAETTSAFTYFDGSGADQITTGGGGDQIDLTHTGNKTVNTGDGADTVTVNGAFVDVVINAGDGNDTINIDGAFVSMNVDAGDGADSITIAATAANNNLDIQGGTGDDTITFMGELDSSSAVDGGSDTDVLKLLGGASSLVLTATTITNVEEIDLGAGHNYGITTNDATVAAGATLTMDASALGAGDSLTFDGSAETNGSFTIDGGAGLDALTGGSQNDTFDMGALLTAADAIDGGAGSDTLNLDGDYSAGLTFGASTIADIESLVLAAGHSYNLTTNDGNVASSQTLTVDGSALGAGNSFTFDGSAELDGSFDLKGGAGTDTLTGGAQNDTFDMGAYLTAADTLNGGAGTDTLNLDGDYSAGLTFGATTLANVEDIAVAPGHSYNLTTNDATVVSGQTLTVDASALGASDTLTFDGSAETDGHFAITGGAGDDSITIGAKSVFFASTIDGGSGDDTLTLNGNYGVNATLGATTIQNIDTLVLQESGHAYSFNTNDANVAAGQTMTVDASAITESMFWNAQAEKDGFFNYKGGTGNDTIELSSQTVLAGSTIDGGDTPTSINNTLFLQGDFSTLTTLGSNISNILNLSLNGAFNYNFVTTDALITAGAHLNVENTGLGTHTISFDGSAETDGYFDFFDGAGNDTLTGGAQADIFNLDLGGNDTAHGGGGNDMFSMGGTLTAADAIDGGADFDTLELHGNYSAGVTFGASTITNIETLKLDAGDSYNFTTDDANVASGATLTVNASALGSSDAFTFNGSAETDGNFTITGGEGVNTITGGSGDDTISGGPDGTTTITGGLGGDHLGSGTGVNYFVYSSGSESLVANPDTVYFNTDSCQFDMGFLPTYDGEHAMSNSSGDMATNIANSIGALNPGAGYAVILDDTLGVHWLVVDANNDGAYTAGTDYVIDLVVSGNISDFGSGSFI